MSDKELRMRKPDFGDVIFGVLVGIASMMLSLICMGLIFVAYKFFGVFGGIFIFALGVGCGVYAYKRIRSEI